MNQRRFTICIGRVISEFVSDQLSDDIEQVRSWTTYPGGSASNVAFGLARLGCPVRFIGCVGNDAAGEHLRHSLEKIGIDTTGLRVTNEGETGWLWTLRHPNGESSFHPPQVSFEHFADAQLSRFDIIPSLFEDAGFLVPQSAHLGPEQAREGLFFALEVAQRNDVRTIFDVNYRPFAWRDLDTARHITKAFGQDCDYIKVSHEEAARLFEVDSLVALIRLFPNARGILLTRASGGAEYFLNGFTGSVASPSVPVVDATGAGDAFVAAFVAKMTQHGEALFETREGCEEILRFATAAGAICVSKPGAVNSLPSEEEIRSFLEGLTNEFSDK